MVLLVRKEVWQWERANNNEHRWSDREKEGRKSFSTRFCNFYEVWARNLNLTALINLLPIFVYYRLTALFLERKMVYKRMVEIGRIVYIANGANSGKLAAIVNVVDGNRVNFIVNFILLAYFLFLVFIKWISGGKFIGR